MKFYQNQNQSTYSYLHSLISLQPLSQYPLLICYHPSCISSLNITYRSFRYASRRLWNQLPDSSRQPSQLVSHVSTHLLIHLSAHLCHHHHSQHPSLLHSFTPGSKPSYSTNSSHLNFTSLLIGLPSRYWDWTGLIMLKSQTRVA